MEPPAHDADGKRLKAKERGRAKKRAMSVRALGDLDRWLAGNALPAAAE
jgi:methylenetetrahydrofolate--tRNA-(uracil-5-)-methyltransferase